MQRAPSRHVWCEAVPYDRFADRGLTSALYERAIQPIVAVTPSTVAAAGGLVARLRDAGLTVALWPMLEPADGRWASVHTWSRWTTHVAELLSSLSTRDALPDELAIDLEPPLSTLRAAIDLRPRLRGLASRATAPDVPRWIEDLRGAGMRVSAAVMPVTVTASPRVARGWQRLLGTPVDDAAYDRVSAMAYSSLLEGYSRGWLSRRDALAFVAATASDVARRFGTRASLSLGCVGPGTLGDERCYRSPAELAQDVAVARAGGIDDLALFDLAGVLARPPIEPWLDALVDASGPAVAHERSTPRAVSMRAVSTAIGFAADLVLGVAANGRRPP